MEAEPATKKQRTEEDPSQETPTSTAAAPVVSPLLTVPASLAGAREIIQAAVLERVVPLLEEGKTIEVEARLGSFVDRSKRRLADAGAPGQCRLLTVKDKPYETRICVTGAHFYRCLDFLGGDDLGAVRETTLVNDSRVVGGYRVSRSEAGELLEVSRKTRLLALDFAITGSPYDVRVGVALEEVLPLEEHEDVLKQKAETERKKNRDSFTVAGVRVDATQVHGGMTSREVEVEAVDVKTDAPKALREMVDAALRLGSL